MSVNLIELQRDLQYARLWRVLKKIVANMGTLACFLIIIVALQFGATQPIPHLSLQSFSLLLEASLSKLYL